MRSQRWQWTHTYGVHLLVASIVAVVLAGSGLATVVTLGDDEEPPDPPRQTGDPTNSPPPPSQAPTGTLDAECVLGAWQAVALEDIALTGTWTLVAGGPTFEYRDDGTGVINYDPEGGEGTTFEFEDDIFGGTSNSVPSGTRDFQYAVDQATDTLRHTYLDLLGGAQMHGLPYTPNEDTFTTSCSAEEMTLQGDAGTVALNRIDP